MKQLGIALLLITIVIACGSRKDAKSNGQTEIISEEEVDNHLDELEDLNETPLMENNGGISTSATIRDKSLDNCGFLVEVLVDGEPKLLEPLRLDSAFQVEGLTVNVTYRLSRRPSTCLIAIPIVIDEIETN